MNPGGLRAGHGRRRHRRRYPRTLTYKQAADVQPFANTLVNMDLTGAQIKATLEQQWQPAGASRPFLRLGRLEGLHLHLRPGRSAGGLRGSRGCGSTATPIDLATTYSVTVNSFLASGGDNFTALAGGTGKQDTGMTDLQAMVDYMAEFANIGAGDRRCPVDYASARSGVRFPAGAPASYAAGRPRDLRPDLAGR